tara:strand:- start:2632 stop:3021 length:390 start_codon:yes stop_codon:yes gene_type:complete
MDPTILDILINAGPLGALSVYLIVKNNKLDAKLDKILSDAREAQIAQDEKAQAREDMLRARYDDVINDLQKRGEDLRLSMAEKIASLVAKTSDLQKKIDSMIAGITQIQDQIKEFKMEKLAVRAVRETQ